MARGVTYASGMQRLGQRVRPWEPGQVRLFISHENTTRVFAGELKVELAQYGIDGFVAHDDIEPTQVWENEIVAALQTCEAFVVLLADGVHASSWVDQECGWALGRDIRVIPVALGLNPYGFLGRFQAVPGAERTAEQLGKTILELLLGDARTATPIIETVVAQFEAADSWADARDKFERLDLVPVITQEQLARIEQAYRRNGQVSGAFYVQNRISEFLRRHWDAHGVVDYHMAGGNDASDQDWD
jgi:hypothetical protein